jgi:hypothetical protein
MSMTRIGRPGSNTRSARRSLVELTAVASRGVDDGLFVISAGLVAATTDEPPQSEQTATTSELDVDTKQAKAPVPVGAAEPLNARVPSTDEFLDSDSTAEMFVKIAKDYQNRALESIKANLNAGLDHAKDFAEKRAGSEAASNDRSSANLSSFLTVLEGVKEINAEVLELMKANVLTTLEHARGLASATTTADFIELSSAQARRQCELILKQAGALKSLAHRMTKSGGD